MQNVVLHIVSCSLLKQGSYHDNVFSAVYYSLFIFANDILPFVNDLKKIENSHKLGHWNIKLFTQSENLSFYFFLIGSSITHVEQRTRHCRLVRLICRKYKNYKFLVAPDFLKKASKISSIIQLDLLESGETSQT